MKKLKILVLLLSVAAFAFAFKPGPGPVKDNLFTTIAFKLYEFYAKYPQEKVYLHHDKNLYSLGETIWFKAYLTVGPRATVDTLSKILYVDLVSPASQVVLTRQLKANQGTAYGDIQLPDTLTEGTYQLRAYTSWMRNFSPDYFFTREVKVVSPSLSEVKAAISFRTTSHGTGDSVTATLQFYKLPFEPLQHLQLNTYLMVNGKKQKRVVLMTSDKGLMHYSVSLPKQKNNSETQAFLLVETADASENKFRKTYRLPVGQQNIDLQFFPESGQLVNGIASRLAFKAIDISGKGTAVEGGIYDQQGNKITDFKSEHLGMGQLLLIPQKGNSYEARIRQENGTTAVYPIAKAADEGVVMRINRIPNNQLALQLTNTFSGQRDSTFLVAHAEGRIFFAAKPDPAKREITAILPTSRFPGGLVYFTLFDRTGRPLCERLVYANQPERLQVAVSTDKQVYGQREKVTMQVQVQDANGAPVAGNFSVAVRDANTAPDAAVQQENIYSYAHLSSELKGHIEQPAYYLDKSNPGALHHLDLLLMTQGWRRFSWNDIMQNKEPQVEYPLEQQITITGVVEKEFGRKKETGTSKLTIILKGGEASESAFPNISMAETMEDGRFYITGFDHQDTLQVFLQARTPKGGKNLLIKRDVYGSAPAAFFPAEEVTMLDDDYLSSISNWARSERSFRLANGGINLQEVEVTAQKEKPDSRRRHSKEFTDATINVAEDGIMRSNVLEYLLGRVAGVQVTGSGMNMSVSIRGGGAPVFILDGMQVDLDYIQSLSPADVETIEVLKGANGAVYANSSNGVIAIFTKRGNPNYNFANNPTPGAINFKLPGYYSAQEFYVPRYDVPDDRHNLPDFRNTLHWQHTLLTDESGRAELSFFTSDDATSFITTCEGFSGQGAVGVGEHTFEVQQGR